MSDLRQPPYVSDEEWARVLKRLTKVRERYKWELLRNDLTHDAADDYKRQLQSDQFLALIILLELRQPKIQTNTVKVQDGPQIVNELTALAVQYGISFS